MPIWAFLLTCAWMLLIPYFTKESLNSIFDQNPTAREVPAKCTSLFVGVLWPIFFSIGVCYIIFGKKLT